MKHINVSKCIECPFAHISAISEHGDTICCHHPQHMNRNKFTAVIVIGDAVKNHIIFDSCPLISHPIQINYSNIS